MQVNLHLSFNGRCEAAFKYYERHLDGKIEAMARYAGTPAEKQVPNDWRNKIIHARLRLDDQVLTGADAPPGRYEIAQGFSATISVDDPAEAQRIFRALAENGSVRTPLEKTFFAERFGILKDQFGVPWMIICEQAAARAA